MEDLNIVALYWERNQQAIEETERQYGKLCHHIAYRILENREEAEECVNDTFLRAWNTIPPQRPTHLGAFLGKITRCLALDRYRQNTAQKRGGSHVTLLLDELAECTPSCETVADDLQLKDLLNRFLGSLSAVSRRLFVLRYWYAYSTEEIGKMEGIRPKTVATSLFRTREKLKQFLQEEGVTV